MNHIFPGWSFISDKMSAGIFRASGRDRLGRIVEPNGTDPDALIEKCKEEVVEIVTIGNPPDGKQSNPNSYATQLLLYRGVEIWSAFETLARVKRYAIYSLVVVFNSILIGNLEAQILTTLHSFADGSDGANPYAGLVLCGNTLYGTADNFESPGYGSVFAVNTDGSGFTNLYDFTDGNDGAYPEGELVLSGNTLYGTTSEGGSANFGTIFAINTDGTNFRLLHTFSGGNDGANPGAGLVLAGGTLYGTAIYGGDSGDGTVFAVNTNCSDFRVFHSFTGFEDG